VLDIHTNPKNPVIGDRALGETPDVVSRLGRIIIEELQRAGVAACGKHFPGHGDTATDSHVELPIVEHPPDRLRAVEFLPFKEAIAADVAFIMTAHVLVTTIDDEHPATLSPKIVQRILREELGFTGVIVSDDLQMHAITKSYTPADAAVAAIAAGCDALLVCGDGAVADLEIQIQVLEALIHAVEEERLSVSRVEDALARNRAAKERFVREWRPPTAPQLRQIIGSEEHRAISEQMAEFA
jgi:beta-N-acetylhexosaminidase